MAFKKRFSKNNDGGSFADKFTHVASIFLNEGGKLRLAFKDGGSSYLVFANNFTSEGKRLKKLLENMSEDGEIDGPLLKVFQKNEEDEYFSKKSKKAPDPVAKKKGPKPEPEEDEEEDIDEEEEDEESEDDEDED